MSPPPSTGSEPVCTSTQCMYQGLGNQERKKWSHPRRSSGPRVEIRKGHQQQWDEIRPVSQPHPPKPQPRGTTVLLVLRIHPVIASISTSGSFILSSSLSLFLPPFSSFSICLLSFYYTRHCSRYWVINQTKILTPSSLCYWEILCPKTSFCDRCLLILKSSLGRYRLYQEAFQGSLPELPDWARNPLAALGTPPSTTHNRLQ